MFVVLGLFSCNSERQKLEKKLPEKQKEIKEIAEAINQDFVAIQHEVEALAEYTTQLYENQDSYVCATPDIYTLSDEGVWHKKRDDGKSAVFVSGAVPINKEIRRIVEFTEPLDIPFKTIVSKHPEVVQAYYNDRYSYNRIYPFFDVLMQYEALLDIPTFNFYYLADLEHNPEKKAVWVNEPYVDPAGRGWMVSAIAPVYFNNELQGVPGLDVTIQTITDKYLKSPEFFVIDQHGLLIAADESIVNLLDLPTLIDHKYFETIKSDTYRKNEFNLLKHRNKGFRSFFEQLVRSSKPYMSLEINNTNYYFITQNIEQLDWTIICKFKTD